MKKLILILSLLFSIFMFSNANDDKNSINKSATIDNFVRNGLMSPIRENEVWGYVQSNELTVFYVIEPVESYPQYFSGTMIYDMYSFESNCEIVYHINNSFYALNHRITFGSSWCDCPNGEFWCIYENGPEVEIYLSIMSGTYPNPTITLKGPVIVGKLKSYHLEWICPNFKIIN